MTSPSRCGSCIARAHGDTGEARRRAFSAKDWKPAVSAVKPQAGYGPALPHASTPIPPCERAAHGTWPRRAVITSAVL